MDAVKDSYTAFCEVYDEFMDNVDYEAWAGFICERLREHGISSGLVLDLGCGTGLELEYYFPRNPAARVTGIDLAPGMLGRLREKFPDKALRLINGSYFDVPLEAERYDAVVSVESLHHFTAGEKLPLYQKLS